MQIEPGVKETLNVRAFSISDDQFHYIKETATAYNLSMSQLVRQMIEHCRKEQKPDVRLSSH